jgi:hypothetical protein
MGNFTLPRGPCNFLNLHISPWKILFLFLLCSPSLWRPFFFPNGSAFSLGIFPLPPSLRGAARRGSAQRSTALAERAGGAGAGRRHWSRRGSWWAGARRRVCGRGAARRAGLERAGGAPARRLGVDQHGDSKAPRVEDLVVARRAPRGEGAGLARTAAAGMARAKGARGSGMCRCGAARPG